MWDYGILQEKEKHHEVERKCKPWIRRSFYRFLSIFPPRPKIRRQPFILQLASIFSNFHRHNCFLNHFPATCTEQNLLTKKKERKKEKRVQISQIWKEETCRMKLRCFSFVPSNPPFLACLIFWHELWRSLWFKFRGGSSIIHGCLFHCFSSTSCCKLRRYGVFMGMEIQV